MIKLTDLPYELLLHISSFLDDDSPSDRVTFAGVLNNYDMLEYYLRKYDKLEIIASLVFSENSRAVQ